MGLYIYIRRLENQIFHQISQKYPQFIEAFSPSAPGDPAGEWLQHLWPRRPRRLGGVGCAALRGARGADGSR